MKNAIIFDFDGTIAETIPLTLQAIRAAYADNSLPLPTKEKIVSNFGANEYGMFHKMSPDCADKLFESYLSEYATLHEKYSPKPFDGIVDVLHKIKNSGWKLGLVTGKHEKALELSLYYYGLRGVFDGIRCGGIDRSIKTKNISSLLSEWEIKPENSWYIGDVASDISDARAAGAHPLSAAWAHTKLAQLRELEELSPEKIFRSVKEFGAWIDNLLNNYDPINNI